MANAQITQNSILRISDQKTLEFLELYKNEECLWNTTLENYTKKVKRRAAAERIAKTLNVDHFTGEHVIMKFRNLRSAYMQDLKKIANSVAAGDEPVYRPKVFWFSKMDFLRPHLQLYKASKSPTKVAKATRDDNKTVHKVKEEYDDNFSYEEIEVEYHEPPEKRSRNISTASKESVEDNNDSNIYNPIRDDSQPLARHEDGRFDGADNCFPNVLKTIAPQPERLSRPTEYFNNFVKYESTSTTSTPLQRTTELQRDDCFDSFGKYVSAMLKNMPIKRAMALQPEIVKLLVSGTIDNEGHISQSDQNQSL